MLMNRDEFKYLFTEDATQEGDKLRMDFFNITQKNYKRNVCFTVLYFMIEGTNIDKYLNIDNISKPTFTSSVASFVYVKLNNGVYQNIFNENDRMNTNRSITNILATVNIPNYVNIIELIDMLIYLINNNRALTNEIKEKKVIDLQDFKNVLLYDINNAKKKTHIKEKGVNRKEKCFDFANKINNTYEVLYKNNTEENDNLKEVTVINKIGNEALNISEKKIWLPHSKGIWFI